MNDPPRDTKFVDNMVFDEVVHISELNLLEWCSFCPLLKVISYCKDEPMTFYLGGLISPVTSIPLALNGHAMTVGWSSSGVGV